MAESVETQGTSLQTRLLKKMIAQLNPVAKLRSKRFALLLGLGEAADVTAERAVVNTDLAERLPRMP